MTLGDASNITNVVLSYKELSRFLNSLTVASLETNIACMYAENFSINLYFLPCDNNSEVLVQGCSVKMVFL